MRPASKKKSKVFYPLWHIMAPSSDFTVPYAINYIVCLSCGLLYSLLLLRHDIRVSSGALEAKLAIVSSVVQALLFLTGIVVAVRMLSDHSMADWLDLVIASALHLFPTTIVSTERNSNPVAYS